MAKQSLYEQVAEELNEWISVTAQAVADMLKDGDLAPFEANVSEAAALAYYDARFFLPGGSPNAAGRARELARLGPEGYAQAMQAVIEMRERKALNPASLLTDTPRPARGYQR